MNARRHWFASLVKGSLLSLSLLVCGLAGSKAQVPFEAAATINIQSPSDFYDALAPYGSWVNVGPYGQCWRPANVVRDWRPYTQGYWEWTDAGWYWVSDEPWAWACYHYGQWMFDPVYGWVWLPGTDWAPAWVVWREAPDYIGWAPCGPGGVVVAGAPFVFVDIHHFHDRLGPRELVFNDSGILRRSRPVGEFRSESRDFGGVSRRIAFNPGPGVDPIQRATGRRFTPRPVHELVRQTAVVRSPGRRPDERDRSTQPLVNRQQPQTTTGTERGRLYRETPPVQTPPTGRQQQRIYHEVPNPQPVPVPPAQMRRAPVEVPTPPTVAPRERPLPPTGYEHRPVEGQTPRREERAAPPQPAPRITPRAPEPAAPLQPPPRRENRDHERDGQP